jgi:hypothetical protein
MQRYMVSDVVNFGRRGVPVPPPTPHPSSKPALSPTLPALAVASGCSRLVHGSLRDSAAAAQDQAGHRVGRLPIQAGQDME